MKLMIRVYFLKNHAPCSLNIACMCPSTVKSSVNLWLQIGRKSTWLSVSLLAPWYSASLSTVIACRAPVTRVRKAYMNVDRWKIWLMENKMQWTKCKNTSHHWLLLWPSSPKLLPSICKLNCNKFVIYSFWKF